MLRSAESAPSPSNDLDEVLVEDEFVQHILNPYSSKQCIYVKSARHSFRERTLASRATFSIPESCYIDSTGHFNSVELNICYNQMFYLLWADGIRRQFIAEVSDWDVDLFKARQLPNMLIVRFKSDFRRPIGADQFSAEGSIDKVRVMGKPPRRTIFVRSHASFVDGNGGLANGEADFAIVP